MARTAIPTIQALTAISKLIMRHLGEAHLAPDVSSGERTERVS
jgi:hypothetical protein